MTSRNVEMTVHPALGGLDISSDATVLDPNFLVSADNVEYREGGQRKRRPGFRVYSSSFSNTIGNPGNLWTHEAATRPSAINPAASVFVSDTQLFAFHRHTDGITLHYDVSTDGGVTWPTDNATSYIVNDDVIGSRNVLLGSGVTRFVLLCNVSNCIAYSDNVLTLPTTSTWTRITPPGSVSAPLGYEFNGLNGVIACTDGGNNIKLVYSTDGGTTWSAATTNITDTSTTAVGTQIFCSPAVNTWVFINPNSGKIYRSTDGGNNWGASVKTMTAGDATLSKTATILKVTATRVVATYKGQVATSDDAGATWTDRQNLTLIASSPLDVRQGNITGLCNFGVPTGAPILGGMSTYIDVFAGGTTAAAAWSSSDNGTTWTIINVAGGASHGSSTVIMTGFIARQGRGVADLWNSGATARDTWYSLPPAGTSMVGSTASVRAIEDYWKYGNSLTPTQQYVAVTGASIFASSGQGVWNALTNTSSFGTDGNTTTNITLAGDYAVISDGASPPVAYDQTGFSSTALLTAQTIPSALARTIFAATSTAGPLTVTTTGLFTFTSTLGLITLISTSDITSTSPSTITNPSTSPSVIFTSTSTITFNTTSNFTSTFGLTTTMPVTVTPATPSVLFQSLVNGWSSSAGKIIFTSTNNFSTWPVWTHASYHLNRLFYQGISTAPSQVGYTAASNIFDSTGSDTGTFPVATGDGDQVMALSKPFYGSLYVFKGPQKGSVWQLSGNTPTSFSMVQVGYGAPILNARAMVTTPTDIYWLSLYGVHSLQTTVKFGNVDEAFLSLPIQKLWRDRILNHNTLNTAWGFWHPQRNIVGWAVQPTGDTKKHWLLCYNYALSDPKPGGKKFWSIWKVSNFATMSGAVMLVTSLDGNHQGDPHLYIGGDTGIVYEGDQETVDTDYYDAGTPYTVDIKTPTLTRFKTGKQQQVPETQEKSFEGIVTYFTPKGSGASATMTVTIDQNSVQSYTVPFTGGGATLG